MALPETIAIRRTEEEAEFVSVRPVVRQTFRIDQLVDMLLAVTGKDAARLQQILRSGTVVYHYYRYWWPGFAAADDELSMLLATFPDADPTRVFDPHSCTAVLLEGPDGGHRKGEGAALELERTAAARNRLFHAHSLWDLLLAAARDESPSYETYSYSRRADLYALTLSPIASQRLSEEGPRLAARELRPRLESKLPPRRLRYVSPRPRAIR